MLENVDFFPENWHCALQAGIHSTNKKTSTNQGVVLIIAPRNKIKALEIISR